MLFAPSPTYASVWPASAPVPPRSWAIVRRSARIWHGWKSSVSALTTGTRLIAAISSIRSWPNVRHTIADACRSRTRVTSATDSRTPTWASRPSTTTGKPPSSAMPVANESCVRSVGLSNRTATPCGPASGWRNVRSSRNARPISRT